MSLTLRLTAVALLSLGVLSSLGCIRYAPAADESSAAPTPRHEDTCPFCKKKHAAGEEHDHAGETAAEHEDHDHAHEHGDNHQHDHE